VVIVVGAVLLIGFLMIRDPSGGTDFSALEQAKLGKAMLNVAGEDVFEGTLRDGVSAYLQQALRQKSEAKEVPETTPTEHLTYYANALSASIGEAVLKSIIKKEGLSVDDDDIIAFLVKGQEGAIAEQRSQFDVVKNIRTQMAETAYEDAKKKDAGSKDTKDKLKALEDIRKSSFEGEFKQQNGGLTPQQAIDSLKERAPEVLSDPQNRRAYELQALLDQLRAKLSAKVDTSDEAIKKTYDKIVYQQIALTSGGKAKGDEVLKKIRAGMSFKDAAVQFTSLKDATGKPMVNDVTQVRNELQSLEGFKTLLTMKPGEVSEVQMVQKTAYILKLIEVKPDVPKDFDTAKKQRAKQLQDAYSQEALTKLVEDTKAAAVKSVRWNDDGWKLVFDWDELRNGDKSKELDGAENKQKRIAAYKEIVARSKETVSNATDIAPLVRYAALQQLDIEINGGVEEADIRKQLSEATEEMVLLFPSTQLRSQLITQYLDEKNGDKALEQLLEIAKSAFPAGPRTESLVLQVEKQLPRAANLASKDNKLIGDIQKELQLWREEDKQRIADELKAQVEADRLKKENEKQEAELRKKEAAEKQNKPQPPVGTPPPQPGG